MSGLDKGVTLDASGSMAIFTQAACGFMLTWVWSGHLPSLSFVHSIFSRAGLVIQETLIEQRDCGSFLYHDVRQGDEKRVKALVKQKADVNQTDLDKLPLLTTAVEHKHEKIVTLLLESKADANQTAKNGRTPVSVAKGKGYENIVKILLENKALPLEKFSFSINQPLVAQNASLSEFIKEEIEIPEEKEQSPSTQKPGNSSLSSADSLSNNSLDDTTLNKKAKRSKRPSSATCSPLNKLRDRSSSPDSNSLHATFQRSKLLPVTIPVSLPSSSSSS